MKITLLTAGAAGDVTPFLALALGLRRLGYGVTFAAPANFESYLKPFLVDYRPLPGDTRQIFESGQSPTRIAHGKAIAFMKAFSRLIHEIRFDLQRDLLSACWGSDAIIVHPLFIFEAAVLSEKLQKPFMLLLPFPLMPATSMFPQLLMSPKRTPFGFINKLTYRLFACAHEKGKLDDMNEWRAQLGLEPVHSSYYASLEKQQVPIIHAYSQELVPFPKDWSSCNRITGVIKLSNKQTPFYRQERDLENLDAWLAQGPAPIYFGFGSLPVLESQRMIDMVLDITKQLHARAVIACEGAQMAAGKQNWPGSVYRVRSVNHQWLFPRCSCVIHHGGAGTTHTALESGVPSVICSAYADQPFWGEKIAELSVGRHIPIAKLTVARLIQAIRELQNDEIRNRAAAIGKKMRAENGLQNALDWVTRHLPSAPIYKNQ